MRTAAWAAGFACGMTLLVGCRCSEDLPGADTAAPGPSTSVGVLSAELARQVLAKIGDRELTLGDYAAALERMDRFERSRYQSAERRRQLLDEMIAVELLAEEARRRGLDDEPDVQRRIDQVLRDLVLAELRATLPGPEAIPESEVRAHYAEHRSDFAIPERRRLSVIVLATRQQAEAVLAEAREASPARWGELVRSRSLRREPAGQGDEGLRGDVGFVTAPGSEPEESGGLPEVVRRAGFAISAPGQVHAEVVEADGKAYVVRLVTRNPAGLRSYAEAERAIRVTLAQRRIRQAEAELERELRARFPVEIDREALARIRVAPAPAVGQEDAGARGAGADPR